MAFGLMTVEPLVACKLTESIKRLFPSASVSFANTGTNTGLSSFVFTESSFATGGVLLAVPFTEMVTVPILLSEVPLFALNVNKSLPVKFTDGVYEVVAEVSLIPDIPDKLPCATLSTIKNVRGPLDGDVPVSVMFNGILILVDRDWSLTVGELIEGPCTSTITWAISNPPFPSVTL